MRITRVAFVLLVMCQGLACGQTPYRTQPGGMALYVSSAATGIVEKVRTGAPGVLVEILVKPGDLVRKGQILAHTDLDATKYQMDLAQHAAESKSTVDAARDQAEAWTATREETETAVRQHKAARSRLDWALAMEKMYRATYAAQVESKDAQQIQYGYWKEQYEKRFLRAPVDGVVSEILVEIGKPVNIATQVFTIRNDNSYAIPVQAPALLADAAVSHGTVPVRAADGKSVTRASVDSVTDDPLKAGWKIIRLFIQASDFPAGIRSKIAGMKFEVLLPQVAKQDAR